VFNGVKRHAELIEEEALKQQELNKQLAKEFLQTETVVPIKSAVETSLADLKARLQNKIAEQRSKGGIPGNRAERDKLLPPRNKRVGGKDQNESKEPVDEESRNAKKKEAQQKRKEELEARISYGALKVDDSDKKKKLLTTADQPKRSETSTRSIMNVKKLIKKAQDGQARLAALKAEGKGDVVAEEKWDTLEKKAAGEKIRDDPRMLKKALKRLEKKKEHSSQEWQERRKKEESDKKERSDQKEKNVQDRKVKKIEKRGGVVASKPSTEASSEGDKRRRRPGFEGSNVSFKKNNSSPSTTGKKKNSFSSNPNKARSPLGSMAKKAKFDKQT